MGAKPETLAKEYYELAGGEFPVNLRELCRRLNVRTVRWKGPPGFTALLAADIRAIVVNANMPLTRQRFSIAHELGHLAYDRTGVHPYGGRGGSETGAHAFAGALLMPAEEVGRLWDEHKWNPEFREEALCAAFLVSRGALEIRLKNLRIVERRKVWRGFRRRRNQT